MASALQQRTSIQQSKEYFYLNPLLSYLVRSVNYCTIIFQKRQASIENAALIYFPIVVFSFHLLKYFSGVDTLSNKATAVRAVGALS